jgi:hypothetical protein
LQASAAKITRTQEFKKITTLSQQRHQGAVFTVGNISNQTVAPSGNEAPDGNGYFRVYSFSTAVAFNSPIQVIRLLPDLHSIVKLIIFPQHFFW